MNNKVLIVTTVASTIDQFCMNDIEILLSMGKKVHVLANFKNGNNTSSERIKEFQNELINKKIVIHETDMSRSPFSRVNLNEYKKIKQLLKEEKFDLIHCHTPIASILVRLAAREVHKNGTKVIYSAHGFHFFKGAPLLNWLIYYPAEKICSRFTDMLITINKEDYRLAQHKMKAKKIAYIPGVGVDTDKFENVEIDREIKKRELGIPEDAIILLSVAELNKNKNQEVIIRALAKIDNSNIHYCIAGKGKLDTYLKELVHGLNIEDRVNLLGFRTDIGELCKVADIFCFPSYREGLGLAAIEAMSTGLPLITSNVHGINDYSQNGITGFACKPSAVDEFVKAIDILVKNKELREQIRNHNINFAKEFDIKIVNREMKKIYEEVIS